MTDFILGGNTGASLNWNYSNPQKENYNLAIMGTIIRIQEVQSHKWTPNGPGAPEFWDDGKPKMNIRVLFAQCDGSLVSWTFQKMTQKSINGGKQGAHASLQALARQHNLPTLMGHTITVSTQEGNWGQGNPRPFMVALSDDQGIFEATQEIPSEYDVPRLIDDTAAHGGQMQTPPPMQGGYYAPPAPMVTYNNQVPPVLPQQQQVPNQAYQAQPMQYQQAYQQPVQPVMQQVPQGQVPQGMDPQLATAVQSMGTTNIQQVQQVPQYYDPSIPF